jgi:uncharacterized protein (TIGR00299 family) protein
MTIAYLDVFFGISGDMTLGALVDAGVDPDELTAELGKLHIHDWEISFEKVRVKGLGATRATVSRHHHHDHHHGDAHGPGHHGDHHHGMRPSELIDIIEDSDLDDAVKQRSIDVIDRIAEVEAEAHQVSLDEVHFHELGGLDTVIDVVGAVTGFDLLGVDAVYSSPIPLAHGFVNTAHGRLAVPVPAVVGLVKGHATVPLDVDGETVTPTGAAIATVLTEGVGPMPPMTLLESGFGAGHKDFPEGANLLRIMVGETQDAATAGGDTQVLLEANIDDMNPELYEPAREAVFDAGAVDCWFTPIVMKKNRPGVQFSALAPPDRVESVEDAILTHTTTLGVRRIMAARTCLDRQWEHVDTPYGRIGIKLGLRGGRVLTASPEFDDCQSAADEFEIPVKMVYEAALAAYAQSDSTMQS